MQEVHLHSDVRIAGASCQVLRGKVPRFDDLQSQIAHRWQLHMLASSHCPVPPEKEVVNLTELFEPASGNGFGWGVNHHRNVVSLQPQRSFLHLNTLCQTNSAEFGQKVDWIGLKVGRN